jgi:hypothetical protein
VAARLKTIGNPTFVDEDSPLPFSNNQLRPPLDGVFVSRETPYKLISSIFIPFDDVNEFTE